MIKEELKAKVEEAIETNCSEGGLERDDVIETVFYTFMYEYWNDVIERDDLLDVMEYLELWADMNQIDTLKENRKKRLIRRELAKAKRSK